MPAPRSQESTVHESPLADREQLDLIQRLGRVGYWEYDGSSNRFWLPTPSLQLLSTLVGTSPLAMPTLREIMPEAERQRFRTALVQACEQRLELHLELQLSSLRGDRASILVKGSPTDHGGTQRFAGVFQDITSEKAVEAQREAVLSQLHALVAGLPVGVTVFDEDLRLLFWNDHIYDILGLPQGAVYKYVSFADLIRYPARRGEYGPGDPDDLVAQRVELARRFQPHRFERAARDGRFLLVDGYPFRFGGRVAGFVTTYTDITERKRIEEQLSRQNDALRTIIDNFPGAVSVFDSNLRLVAFNSQFSTLLEIPRDLLEREGVRFEDLIRFNALRGEYGDDDPESYVATAVARARSFEAHTVQRTRPNGTVLEIIGRPLPTGGFVSIYIDITERKQAEERIRAMALTDALTHLPNRLKLNDEMELALARYRETGFRFALLFLDLDGFKKVNDSHGHDAGDELLVEIARRLREAVRETDAVVRLGGDEFIVLLRDIDSNERAQRIAGEIVRSIAEPVALDSATVMVGTSIGISFCPDHGSERETLLKAADEAMYAAKADGRGRWRVANAQ
ncbi:MAG: PAS-domain containing protein [Rhodocyclaceae bacterium]|nr:PAS-domain containing protein [Rhodocyclaceae bacterium]